MAARTKAKTHKGMQKRFKLTASGKLKRRRGGTGHLLSNKSGKRRRQLRKPTTVTDHTAKRLQAKMTG